MADRVTLVAGVGSAGPAEALRAAGAAIVHWPGEAARARMNARPLFAVEPWSVREAGLDLGVFRVGVRAC
jgi:hypothetical protein